MSPRNVVGCAGDVDLDAGHRRTCGVGRQLHDGGVRHERDVRMLEGRPNTEDLGVGLGLHERREPVARGAADARAEGHVPLVQPDPAGRVERVEPCPLEVIGQLLDPRLVRHRREGVGRARRRLGRILVVAAVDLVELLRLRVVRLEVLVRDGPRGRDAVVVLELPEVLPPESIEGGAVELGLAADVVVDPGLEALALVVVPRVLRHVAVLDEDLPGVPVLDLARQPVAAFEQEDPLPGWGEVPGKRAPAGSGADDDHVVRAIVRHPPSPLAAGAATATSSSSHCHPRLAAPIERLRRPFLSEEVHGPALERIHPVAAAGHERRMDAEPGREGELPVELDPGRHLGNRRTAPDHRHRALVEVVERLGRLALEVGEDRLRRRPAALQRDRSELRIGLAVLVRDVGEVADGEDAGKARHREVRLHVDASAATLRQAAGPGDGCRHQAAAPDHRARSDHAVVGQLHVTGSDLGHLQAHEQLDAVLGQPVGGVLVPLVGEHREERIAVIDEVHLRLGGELGELVDHRGRDHLGQGTGDLDPRRAAAHDHERDRPVVCPCRRPSPPPRRPG